MYNVEKYIYRSLNSCINQTLSNIEILIIDDCGSDNSLNIAKSFAKKDKRIKIINNKQNLGTFNARMQGIKEASGYYILFLDADDYLTTNACEVAINAVNNANKTQIAESIDNNFNVDSAPDIIHNPPPILNLMAMFFMSFIFEIRAFVLRIALCNILQVKFDK